MTIPGLYKHYKGNFYTVIGSAIHSETEEVMVIYQPKYEGASVWVRPEKMFNEIIEINGKSVPRFEFVAP
jgi:hypothetical protein